MLAAAPRLHSTRGSHAAPRQPIWKLRPRLNSRCHRQRRAAGSAAGGSRQTSLAVSVCGGRVRGAGGACQQGSLLLLQQPFLQLRPIKCGIHTAKTANAEPRKTWGQRSGLLAAGAPTCCAWESGCACGCVHGSAASAGCAPCCSARQRRWAGAPTPRGARGAAASGPRLHVSRAQS